ncbi:hypothetical protein Sste5346_004695 [Sporothrix stenoceras]|uniref:Uncharacterized protein n=1 Tax=Sporothrix stenoceras TaxID=5173 RepID=A0ABR3Z7Y3_9PEZI
MPEPKQKPKSYFLNVKLTPLDNICQRDLKIPCREPPRALPGFLYPVRKQCLQGYTGLEKLGLHRSPPEGRYDFTELPPLEKHRSSTDIYEDKRISDDMTPMEAMKISKLAQSLAQRRYDFGRLIMSRNMPLYGPAQGADRALACHQRTPDEDMVRRTKENDRYDLNMKGLIQPIPKSVHVKNAREKVQGWKLQEQERQRKLDRQMELLSESEKAEREERRRQQEETDKREKEKQRTRFEEEKEGLEKLVKEIEQEEQEEQEEQDAEPVVRNKEIAEYVERTMWDMD